MDKRASISCQTVRPARGRHAWVVFCLSAFFFLFSLPQALGQVSKEYQIKAVSLWRLAQFVDWPTNVFKNAQDPMVIGVVGENPFGEALNVAIQGETAHGRKLIVEYYARSEKIKPCHILFVSKSETERAKQIVTKVAGQSILTVSDIEGFAQLENGMIGFKTLPSRIALHVNLEAAKSARLVLDARLLRIAEIVKKP